jgi:hypothetical protein
MKQSTANNVSASTLAIWVWLLGPGGTDTTSVQERAACDERFERAKFEERLGEVRREARCVRRAVWLMVFLTALAVVGLGYSTLFIPHWPQTMTQFMMQWTVKAHCVLGSASLTCAIAFSGLDLVYRRKLTRHQDECDRLAGLVPLPINARAFNEKPIASAA